VLVWLRKHGRLDWSNPTAQSLMSKTTETPAQKICPVLKCVYTFRTGQFTIYLYFSITSVALVPPKPKLLDMTRCNCAS
ncbi:MAG: hypothetical protein GJ680_12975, partial [Alteromonadaceae bacterium]|nr:hypothetical protein [Alteromonadaceae bacterium]